MHLPHIAIVLVGAQGDANIGAAARAMKNFGLSDLRLVQAVPHRTESAYRWAVDARDVLDRARCFATLDEALSDRSVAVAFTRRLGKLRRCRMENAELPAWLEERAGLSGKRGEGRTGAALVFGREDKGLSNEEIRRCDAIITIPSAPRLPSLNLAQSVMVACHELFLWEKRRASRTRRGAARPRTRRAGDPPHVEFVPRHEVGRLLARLNTMLGRLGYDDRPPARLRSRIIAQLEHLFGRAGLTLRDIRMFEGLSARIQGVFPFQSG